MIIAHNLAAMNTQRQFGINTKSKAKSTEKLSSGYKVNRAADDAAGLSISEKMRRQIRGLNQGAENTQDGISFLQIGDGAMDEVTDIVHRITELSVKAANGTLTQIDREYIDQEVQELKKELNRISEATVFNEIPVFDNNSVVFGLEGTPTDLEIYDATYDANGNLATYGGFLFHGERISWDMIDPDMVTTSAAGKQVFTGGEYSYTSKETGYSFAFTSVPGTTPPVITREISIEADENGIILGKERFDWSKVYDVNGNTCSEDNLHAGPWAVDYYGAKFVFTVPEPVGGLANLAKNVDSGKNAAVSYNWEVYYKEGAYEQAVDVDMASVEVENDRVTQKTVDTMKNQSETGLEMTVRADETGVWLQQSDGSELANSKKTWEEFGIESWEEGMEVPGWSNQVEVASYTYEDASTGLSYNFELSDITSVDSVIDGLDGMKITGTPQNVTYKAEVELKTGGSSNVTGVSCTDSGIKLSFEEEIDINREFDTQNWTATATSVSFSEVSGVGKVEAAFTGGMTFTGTTNDADDVVRGDIINYLEWVKAEMLNGNTGISAGSHTPNTGTINLSLLNSQSEAIRLEYDYDYTSVFNQLTDNISLDSVGTGHDAQAGLYVQDNGKYVASDRYLNDLIANMSTNGLTNDEIEAAKETLRQQVKAAEKFQFNYMREDNNTSANSISEIADSVIPDIFTELADNTTVKMTSQDYSRVNLVGNEKDNSAYRPIYNAVMREIPREPDIYIVHSGTVGDKTGIYRYAMNTTALGLAFAECKTIEGAKQTMTSTKKALEYVSTKRSTYGALQNRLEHTLNNNRNISENTTAAESRIRDTDMAKEMVAYSNKNILEQVGQAMMAQANQSNQGVLSLLG